MRFCGHHQRSPFQRGAFTAAFVPLLVNAPNASPTVSVMKALRLCEKKAGLCHSHNE